MTIVVDWRLRFLHARHNYRMWWSRHVVRTIIVGDIGNW